MPSSFLFIIPLSPPERLSDARRALQRRCLQTLIDQNYDNWKAILIGSGLKDGPVSDKFIFLNFEGHKEEKLQKASEYILDRDVRGDYIIRLDDDDIFNSSLLRELSNGDFDLYVDRYQTFWDPVSNKVAQKVMYWFPNTCIHKRQHALKLWGTFPPGEYERFRNRPRLIENEHNDFHLYYSQSHKIIFAKKNNPVYLRAMNRDSITANQASDFRLYLNQHGYWTKNTFRAFHQPGNALVQQSVRTGQGIMDRLSAWLLNLRALRSYRKVVVQKSA